MIFDLYKLLNSKVLGYFLFFMQSLVFANDFYDLENSDHSSQNIVSQFKTNTSSHKNKVCCPCPYSYVNPLTKSYVYTEGEWLYWKVIAQIPYTDVVTLRRFGPDDVAYADDDKEEYNRFNLESGYRVKLGLDLPYCGWNFYVQYQRLTNDAVDNVIVEIDRNPNPVSTLNDIKLITAYWADCFKTGDAAKFGSAFSRQNIKYRVFDGALNKSFYVGNHFAFTSLFGFRGAWIKNQLDVTYAGILQDGLQFGDIQCSINLQNNFYGWGLKGALQGNWIIACGFELFGSAAISGLYGDLIFRQTDSFQDVDGFPNPITLINGSLHNETTRKKILTNFELAAGMNWGYKFCRDKFYFGLKFGYELSIWPSLIQLNRYAGYGIPNNVAIGSYSNPVFSVFVNSVMLHGITLGGRLEF